MAATSSYEIDYNDERLTSIENEKDQRLTAEENTYNSMIDNSDQYFQSLIDLSKDSAEQQSQIQQERTDFTIEQIEQQKEQAKKDYTKEQAGAYVDWQKQSNQYGVNAEKMASAGLAGSGFSESSQVSMYNTYQNRVATAREVYNRAVLNYDNAIKDARLQNNAALAEIAKNSLKEQLELGLQGFQYKNQLISELSNKKLQIESMYNDKWKTQLDIMNQENNRAWQADQNQIDRDFQSAQAEIERKFKADQAELDRQHDFDVINANTEAEKKQADYKHQLAMEELEQKHNNDLELLQKEYNLKSSSSSSGSSGGSSSKSSGSGSSSFSKKTTTGSTTTKSTKTTQQSILDLGYGPISPATLNSLITAGVVEEYTQNGVQLFRKTKNGTVNKNDPLKTSSKSNLAIFSNSINDFKRG